MQVQLQGLAHSFLHDGHPHLQGFPHQLVIVMNGKSHLEFPNLSEGRMVARYLFKCPEAENCKEFHDASRQVLGFKFDCLEEEQLGRVMEEIVKQPRTHLEVCLKIRTLYKEALLWAMDLAMTTAEATGGTLAKQFPFDGGLPSAVPPECQEHMVASMPEENAMEVSMNFAGA
jgi:hypothetical protein